MQTRWNLSYEQMKISNYWILGASVAIALLTPYKWVFFAGFALLLALGFFWSWQRTRDLRRYAESNEFAFLGDSLRLPLDLEGTTLAREGGIISNFMVGEIGTTKIAAFDFSFRRGKATVRQTIVGFRKQSGQTADWTASGMVGTYHIERSEDWLLCYIPRCVVEVDELEGWCETLLDLVRLTGTNATAEVPAALNLHRLYTEIG